MVAVGVTVVPDARAISTSVGSCSTVPLGMTMAGKRSTPASVTSAWPSGEPASRNRCGMAQRSSTLRSSYVRPDHVSPTTSTVWGARRRASAQASRKPDTAWWNCSSGGSPGRTTYWSMRPAEIAWEIAAPVAESPR